LTQWRDLQSGKYSAPSSTPSEGGAIRERKINYQISVLLEPAARAHLELGIDAIARPRLIRQVTDGLEVPHTLRLLVDMQRTTPEPEAAVLPPCLEYLEDSGSVYLNG